MDDIIQQAEGDITKYLNTANTWLEKDDFFDMDRVSQPYALSVPSSGIIGGLPVSFSGRNYSTTGYRRNSPHRNRPYNIIPSRNISMKGVDFPVLGIDNKGNRKVMQPGRSYRFKGNRVLEIPMRKRKPFFSGNV
mgnify:CR=1 FL=1